ncbi:SDR family NAD(P)-dependent oxidoreductase [Nakamurella endophytica]|uniref:Short-chain dehydrogenase n=1 Tax=Nakamurella endophytica TaxID=1748367 RepID=A0A917SV68_9ACTN|nr:SDR family oxidoreductase [Nakamurella endophytica]GGL99416.1 short-chain dehydrogenase [Nakamurella endophytica]
MTGPARPAAALTVVTGAASGIGRATASALAEAGHRLLLLDRDATPLAAVAGGTGGTALAVDLADGPATDALVREALAGTPVDVLVNCAGVGWPADTAETTDELWETTLAVNLSGTFRMCRLVLPGMVERGRGVIANVASAGALVGLRRRVAYCASKAGVLGLTRALAADHAGQGVRVFAVCPGTVDTPWVDRMVHDEPDPEAVRRRMRERQLDGRLGSPEEVAGWIAFAVSDQGRFLNGAPLVIDGGLTAV